MRSTDSPQHGRERAAPADGAPAFTSVGPCWICGGDRLARVHRARFELAGYVVDDPPLAAYSGETVWLRRCAACEFGQPEALPALPNYFARMYGREWPIEYAADEFASDAKDLIFRTVLAGLTRRLPAHRRGLLDVGAHVGRLIHLAAAAGWRAEGIEVNPRTASFAAEATGCAVHCREVGSFAGIEARFDAVTFIDVLEHIADPVQTLAAARDVLTPGGLIAVKVPHGPNQLRKELVRAWLQPDYRAAVADNLVHVSHFSRRALQLALERAGFTDVEIEIAPPVLWSESAPLQRRLFANAARLGVYRLGRGLPGGVRTPAALNLQAYARRPVA